MNMFVSSAAVAAAAPAAVAMGHADDSVLLHLEEEIFDEWHAANAHNGEIARADPIWRDYAKRLLDDVDAGRSNLTHNQRWELVWATPEAAEWNRLIVLGEQHFEKMFNLIDEMWAIPAHTEAGRKAKALVLISCVMDWREHDDKMDYRELMARRLLIDLVGGEAASSLREPFAA